jgi:coenzyme Q-binding protein COQ10
MPAATRSIVFEASAEDVFAVVSKYEDYPLFLPEVKQVRVLQRRENVVDVRFDVELVKKIHYTLRMTEERPLRITWTFLEGEFLKDNRGGWRLRQLGEHQTEATYEVEVGLGPLVPKALVNTLVEHSLPRMLQAFARRVAAHKS